MKARTTLALSIGLLVAAACSAGGGPAPSAAEPAARELAALRAAFPGAALAPREVARRRVDVALPARADGATILTDRRSGLALGVRLTSAAPAPRVDVEGVSTFPGAGIVQIASGAGVEDWVHLPARPAAEVIVYELDVRSVAGLRLVGGSLEALDPGGAPRLRMEPPYALDAAGRRVAAAVAVRGCAFDASPAPPWDRPVTAPGAETCTLHVSWSGAKYPVLVDPSWVSAGFGAARDEHTAVKLANGRILTAYGTSCGGGCFPSNNSQVYDPTTQTFANGGSLLDRGTNRPGVLLASGKVLIVGGGAQIYDPALSSFTATAGAMVSARSTPAVVRLPSGKVLVACGAGASAELYDPATDSFTATPPMTASRGACAAALLPTGKVLVAGGGNASAEIYDPAAGANGSFTATGAMATSRDGLAAIALPSGKVVAFGGGQKTIEQWDPAAGKWSAAGSLVDSRTNAEVVLAPSGNVDVVGGFIGTSATALVERWSAATSDVITAPVLQNNRGFHRATVLDSGAVVVTGGRNRNDGFGNSYGEVELLTVASAGAGCAVDDDCGSGICDRGVCCAASCAGPCKQCVATTGACQAVKNADDPDTCAGASTCDGAGACKKKDGQACAAGGECASGFCTDGVCCNVACDGVCEACDGLVKGRCEVVAGRAHGNRPCKSDGTNCGGACDGVRRDVCTYPTAQTGCGTTCKDAVRTAGACDGKGACVLQPPRPCPGNYSCADTSSCKTSCATDADCGRLFGCSNGKCIPAAKCDGDHVILAPDGTTQTDCAPYRCDEQGNRCKDRCADVNDCAAPYFCGASGQCVAAPESPSACAASPGRAAPAGVAVVFFAAALALCARRRRV